MIPVEVGPTESGGDTKRAAARVLTEGDAAAQPLLGDFLRNYDHLKIAQQVHAYVACFSVEGDKPSQWNTYGDHGAGVSIGFRVLSAETHEEPAFARELIAVDYSERSWEQLARDRFARVARCFADHIVRHPTDRQRARDACLAALFRIVSLISLRAKGARWRDEEEWRWVVFPWPGRGFTPQSRQGKDGSTVEYVSVRMRAPGRLFSLSRIILGHRADSGTAARLSAVLDQVGYAQVSHERPAIECSVCMSKAG